MILRRPPDLSVILPTCRPRSLVRVLKQLNAQVLPAELGVETIVVAEADLSTVQLPRHCEVYRKEKGGNCGASARDLGILMARGRYLVFWDDDNHYLRHALLTQYLTALGYDVGVVQIYHTDSGVRHCLPRRMPRVELGDVDTMCLCVRREVAVCEKWDDHKGVGTDFFWLEKILGRGASLHFTPVIIGEHR